MNKVFVVTSRNINRDRGQDDAVQLVYSNEAAGRKNFKAAVQDLIDHWNYTFDTAVDYSQLPFGVSYWCHKNAEEMEEIDADEWVDPDDYEWRIDYMPNFFEITSSWEDCSFRVDIEEVEVLDE